LRYSDFKNSARSCFCAALSAALDDVVEHYDATFLLSGERAGVRGGFLQPNRRGPSP
jgi:hypothetical protein